MRVLNSSPINTLKNLDRAFQSEIQDGNKQYIDLEGYYYTKMIRYEY